MAADDTKRPAPGGVSDGASADGGEVCRMSDEHCYGDFRYRLRAVGTIRLVSYEGVTSDVEIPGLIEGIPVTALASNLFRGHHELRSVVMPDTIEYTGHHVFDDCVGLTSIQVSASLGEIGVTVFSNCHALIDVTFNAPVIKLENNLFVDSPVAHVTFGPLFESLEPRPLELAQLQEISVDKDNTHFVTDGKALYSRDMSHLYRLVVPSAAFRIPEGCTEVDERAFDSLVDLEEIEFPSTLRGIGRLAFAKTHISHIKLPASIERIDEKAFYQCTKLARVEFSRGLRSIGESAFASTALRRVTLPSTLDELGPAAFDGTPAQRHVSEGALVMAPGNWYMDIDQDGGLYSHDVFMELIGRTESYRIRTGTHAIGDGAFKRHPTVRSIEVPEGVFAIGPEAFEHSRNLCQVYLPRSLERIGARAFLDTSLTTLYLSASVREIGEDALLVQGENQLSPRLPLRSVELDEDNLSFYIENGLLCQRDASKSGGDTCLLYVGPDNIVRIPGQVTQIANLAFCGTDRVDELYVHDHLRSICMGAFSTARSIPLVHVAFPRPIDGYSSGDFVVPSLSIRYRSPSYLFGANAAGTFFDFEYYDSWVTHAVNIEEFAVAALHRLQHPMALTEHSRELYEGVFTRKGIQVCRYFASQGNMEALEALCNMKLLTLDDIESELKLSSREGRTQATACLLELRHRMTPETGVDFSL